MMWDHDRAARRLELLRSKASEPARDETERAFLIGVARRLEELETWCLGVRAFMDANLDALEAMDGHFVPAIPGTIPGTDDSGADS